MKPKSKVQWRPQDIRDIRTMGCPLSKAAGMEWSWLKKETVCVAGGGSGAGQTFEAQFIALWPPDAGF